MVKKKIDCLLIGPNSTKFSEQEKVLRFMGRNTGAYRDLNFHVVKYQNKVYSAAEIFKLLYSGEALYENTSSFFATDEVFSSTIAYLGTYLNNRGLTFDFVNSFRGNKEELINKLETHEYTTIGITSTLYLSIAPIIEIIALIKKYNSKAKIVIGGAYILTQLQTRDSNSIQQLLKQINADIYINNIQGETALVNVINAFKKDLPLEGIKNIYYKGDKGYIGTAVSDENNILSENQVDWRLFKDRLSSFVSLRTAISCPFSCSFCEYPIRAGKYQTLDIKQIEHELDVLKSTEKVSSLFFLDDTFNIPVERYKDILRMMIRNKYDFKWGSFLRCQYIDEETIELMKESGCIVSVLGIESASNKVLKNMNKGATIEKYRFGLKLLNEYDIISYASFLVGFPGETYETYKETKDFIEECEPTFFRPNTWYCSTLAPIWNKREEYGLSGSGYEWCHKTMDSATAMNLTEELILTVKNSLFTPLLYEDICILRNKGIHLDKIKEFVATFDMGIKEKLGSHGTSDISSDIAAKLKNLEIKLT